MGYEEISEATGLENVYLILVADTCNSVFNHVCYRE
jgi:hypothetical protein